MSTIADLEYHVGYIIEIYVHIFITVLLYTISKVVLNLSDL